jgi:lipopolysaccharide export system ATP-binding protein
MSISKYARAKFVGLLGPNGAGKTTTFYIIVGLTRPDNGAVMLGNDDITKLPMYMRAKNGIGYLPQEASVFRKLTVEANLMAILETLRISGKERRLRMEGLLGGVWNWPRPERVSGLRYPAVSAAASRSRDRW